MRTMLKTLALLGATAAAARMVTRVVTRRYQYGSEVSDELSRLAVLDGLRFTSRAGGLRRVDVRVVLGGARVDLRHAVIDPGGATVVLENTLGGVVLLVRDDWAVTVDDTLVGGGETQVHVTPPTALPADAPRLTVRVLTRLGGTVITTDPSSHDV